MDDLNRKLADHFGIEPEIEERIITGVITADGVKIPGGRRQEYIYPDFTSSLDDCFEGLVPKLSLEHHRLDSIYFYPNWDGGNCLCEINFEHMSSWHMKVFEASAETPALALCKALERWIDQR